MLLIAKSGWVIMLRFEWVKSLSIDHKQNYTIKTFEELWAMHSMNKHETRYSRDSNPVHRYQEFVTEQDTQYIRIVFFFTIPSCMQSLTPYHPPELISNWWSQETLVLIIQDNTPFIISMP